MCRGGSSKPRPCLTRGPPGQQIGGQQRAARGISRQISGEVVLLPTIMGFLAGDGQDRDIV